MTRSFDTHLIVWRGITIEIRYEERWLDSDGPYSTAHLELRALEPERAPLPMTETGYRSHFAPASVIAEAGGPVAFVRSGSTNPRPRKRGKTRRRLHGR